LLSNETNGFTTINGTTPPGILAPTQNKEVLLDIINDQGQRVLMVKAIRKAGTRVGIHLHKFGGYTIILSGEMTDFVQGKPNKKYGPNSSYYMPPNTPMSAGNLGNKDVELIDIFIGQPGEPYIEIIEPDWNFKKIGTFSN
jgi:quercetin dioxygenase-like cupin family protein